MKQALDIGLGFSREENNLVGNVLCRNYYPRFYLQKNGKTGASLYSVPGGELEQTFAQGVFRGALKIPESLNANAALQNLFVFIIGSNVYRVTIDTVGGATALALIGNIAQPVDANDPRVSMTSNGKNIFIAPRGTGAQAYWIALPALSAVTLLTGQPGYVGFAAQLRGVRSVTLKDNRYVFNTDTEFFVASPATVNNGLTVDALDFEDAEVSNDKIVRVITLSKELVVMGRFTSEIYQNVGGEDFPFRRVVGATIERGVFAADSIQIINDTVYFLGSGLNEGLGIYSGSAGGIKRISNHAIDAVLQGGTITTDQLFKARSWATEHESGVFYGIELGDKTYVWDQVASSLIGNNIWHTREYGIRQPVFKFVGDNGLVYAIAESIASPTSTPLRLTRERRGNDSNGTPLRPGLFTTSYLHAGGERFSVSWVELTLSNATDAAQSIRANLRFSLNGGGSWISMGIRFADTVGGGLGRMQWHRIGRVPRDIMFEFTVSSGAGLLTVADVARVDVDISEVG